MFNRKRLSLARMRRRLTGKGLAEVSGLSAVTISRLENGENLPDESTVERLAKALSFPVEFFSGDDPKEIDTTAVSFRSFSRMTAGERDAAVSAGCLGLELSDWVDHRFALPRPNILDLSYETNAEAAARSLRQFWTLGERPIGHLLGLLETNGIRIFSLSENTATVNAFSFWRNDIPYIFLNNFKTAESSIFDSAHELAHLVLHKHAGPRSSRDAEREANAFASAFLMPAEDVRARMPRYISVSVVLQAKTRWRVSAMAMAYRLNALGLLTERQYKMICIELGRRGYRTGEPDGIEREGSVVWNKVFSQLWAEKTTKNAVADSLYLPLDELEGLVWGLAAGSKPAPPKTGSTKLQAIK